MRLIFGPCCYSEEVSNIDIMRTLWDTKGENESKETHILDALRKSTFASDRHGVKSVYGRPVAGH